MTSHDQATPLAGPDPGNPAVAAADPVVTVVLPVYNSGHTLSRAIQAREYRVMIHYLDAQRVLADSGNRMTAFRIIATHPSTWPLLARRVVGRVARALRSRPVLPQPDMPS